MFINRQKVQEVIMGHIIAISGKGGVGKTTLCGLLIQYLCETGKKTGVGCGCRCKCKCES